MVLSAYINLLKSKSFLVSFFVLLVIKVMGQYAPAVGQEGTMAISKDSSAIVGWAVTCDLELGFQSLADPSLGLVSVGDSSSAIGQASGLSVVSLGDGGSAVLQFEAAIKNGPGADFAVFENSFSDNFLELAFVEVSSDGVNFVRFPASSATQTVEQVGTFGALEATQIDNLAGKYRGGYGTPFDLDQLLGDLNLDVNAVTHVKIIDAVGSLEAEYASYDAQGQIVNDPWPTPFSSSGFDLDGVGVIHFQLTEDLTVISENTLLKVYPNPVSSVVSVNSREQVDAMHVFDLSGKHVRSAMNTGKLDVSMLQQGTYVLKVVSSTMTQSVKISVIHD
jgi:hypothetical protein